MTGKKLKWIRLGERVKIGILNAKLEPNWSQNAKKNVFPDVTWTSSHPSQWRRTTSIHNFKVVMGLYELSTVWKICSNWIASVFGRTESTLHSQTAERVFVHSLQTAIRVCFHWVVCWWESENAKIRSRPFRALLHASYFSAGLTCIRILIDTLYTFSNRETEKNNT